MTYQEHKQKVLDGKLRSPTLKQAILAFQKMGVRAALAEVNILLDLTQQREKEEQEKQIREVLERNSIHGLFC